ncbi:hypothetical protein AB0873_11230 [Micromonospora sp. NPDC047707]|uniref:hypothetical protein n=1 Tax=Micromonospora sp. NPDC047707 TaxID=3154498 RepID=UPI0034549F3E
MFGYGVFASLFTPFTRPAQVATAIPCLAIVGLAVRRSWHRRRMHADAPGDGPTWQAGLAMWLFLLTAAVLFLLLNYFAWPRTVYPTLSWLAGQVFAIPGMRAAAFGLWLWFGWYLVDR